MAGHFVPSSRVPARLRLSLYDIACAALAPVLAFLLRDFSFFQRGDIDSAFIYVGLSFAITNLSFIYCGTQKIFSRYFSLVDLILILKCAAASVMVTALAAFVLSRLDTVPRSVPILHGLVLAGLLTGGRLVARLRQNQREGDPEKAGAVTERVLVIGANRLTWFYIRILETFTPGHQDVLAILDRRLRFQGRAISGYPVIGTPDHLDGIIREYCTHGVVIDRVVVTEAEFAPASEGWGNLQRVTDAHGVTLEYLPERLGLLVTKDGREAAVVAPALVESVPQPVRKRVYWRVKRLIDIAASLVLSVGLAPITLMVACLVAADVGLPTVFWQQRVGRRGRPIRIYKFRTLRAPFDSIGQEIPDDKRLSRVGYFLRLSRLDELPQLFNILRGDMTFIGPRPLLPVDQPRDAALRLSVPPGLTGWAQVHGGKLVTAEEKSALDKWYIQNANFFLDLRIALATVRAMVSGDQRNEKAVSAALQARNPATCISAGQPG